MKKAALICLGLKSDLELFTIFLDNSVFKGRIIRNPFAVGTVSDVQISDTADPPLTCALFIATVILPNGITR